VPGPRLPHKTESHKLQIKINFLGAEVKSLATAVPDWISALKKS
jgi:hypothetical protein